MYLHMHLHMHLTLHMSAYTTSVCLQTHLIPVCCCVCVLCALLLLCPLRITQPTNHRPAWLWCWQWCTLSDAGLLQAPVELRGQEGGTGKVRKGADGGVAGRL